MIKIAEDDSINLYLIRMLEGAELGPHYHKTHIETEYTIKGTGFFWSMING
jgi:quercetin dioxygenase-like cupin family protein